MSKVFAMHAEGPEFGPQHPHKARHEGLSAEKAETATTKRLAGQSA